MTSPSESRLGVSIFSAGISAERVEWLHATCRSLGAVSSAVQDDARNFPEPRLVIAGLPASERRIPAEYLEFIERAAPLASLLLLCDEPLIRTSVSLCEGRVTLVASSAKPEVLGARLRVLLAEPAGSAAAGRERACAHWWAAADASAGSSPLVSEAEGSLRVAFELSEPPAGARPAPALLRLSARADAWQIEWPDAPGTLWLLSSQRLPVVSDLAAAHGGKGPVQVRAASGDIALAVTRRVGRALSPSALKDLSAHAAGGGPPVFDAVQKQFQGQADGRVAVVEVR